MAAARPDSRARILEEIAARYEELIDPLAHTGIKGDGSMAGVLHMPPTYTATVREFERLKAALKRSRPDLHWHLVAYHIRVTRAQKWVPRAVKRRNRHTEWKLEPRIVVYRHPDAQQDQAHDAIRWIANHWALQSEPMLPPELDTPGHTPHHAPNHAPVQSVKAA